MDKSLLSFIILAVVSLILIFTLKASLVKFNRAFKSRLDDNQKRIDELLTFSYDIQFNPPPSEIVIDNPYNCTPTDLRVCRVNDPLSCIGCKSLISSCVHFSKDTKYLDFNGVETIIPKNSNDNEGYCLTQTNASQKCNPYHGDLILVQIDPDAIESMLYCECKNAGYVGNVEINGACDQPFICDGKVEDINKPLEELTCSCSSLNQISTIINDTPVCVDPTIGEFDKYTELFYNNIYTVPKDRFNSDISNNFPGEDIRDPCRYCLLTGEYIPNGVMVESEDGWQCATLKGNQRGLPIRRDYGYRLLAGEKGPDAIINLKAHELYVHGYLYETTFEQMTVSLKVDENRDILNRMDVDLSKSHVYLNLKDHNLVFPGSFGAMKIQNTACLVCDGSEVPGLFDDLFYTCYFNNTISSYRRPHGYTLHTESLSTNPMVTAEAAPVCPPKHHNILSSWAFSDWKHFEAKNPSYKKTRVNGLVKYEIKEGFKTASDVKYIMFIYNFNNSTATFYGTQDGNTYTTWMRNLIPKEEKTSSKN